jgi:hypothetical protein
MEGQEKFYVYYREEQMLPYAFCCLHELYPKWKGWDMSFMRDEQFSYPDFVIERVTGRIVTRVIAMVRMRKKNSEYHIDEMKKYEIMIKGKKHFEIEKVLIVPTGCNVSNVPDDFKIIFLNEF